MSTCCRKKTSKDSIDCYLPPLNDEPSEVECLETSPAASQSPRKTPSLPCFKSSSAVSFADKEYNALQVAFFSLTSHFAKVQFRLRQIIQAHPSERDRLLFELAAVAFCGIEEFKCDSLPRMEKDFVCLGNIRRRQGDLIHRLRGQMDMLTSQTVPVEAQAEEEKDDEASAAGEKKKPEKGVTKKQSKTSFKDGEQAKGVYAEETKNAAE